MLSITKMEKNKQKMAKNAHKSPKITQKTRFTPFVDVFRGILVLDRVKLR